MANKNGDKMEKGRAKKQPWPWGWTCRSWSAPRWACSDRTSYRPRPISSAPISPNRKTTTRRQNVKKAQLTNSTDWRFEMCKCKLTMEIKWSHSASVSKPSYTKALQFIIQSHQRNHKKEKKSQLLFFPQREREPRVPWDLSDFRRIDCEGVWWSSVGAGGDWEQEEEEEQLKPNPSHQYSVRFPISRRERERVSQLNFVGKGMILLIPNLTAAYNCLWRHVNLYCFFLNYTVNITYVLYFFVFVF